MRVLFIGGYGHHYLSLGVRRGLVEPVGMTGDGVDDAAAKQWGQRRLGNGVPWFDDPHHAIAHSRCEAVSIGAVYGHNGAALKRVIEAGAQRIVCDKPIAASWEAMGELEHIIDHSDVRLATEFNLRSDAAFRAAHEVVKRGWIGTPVLATAQKSYRFGQTRPAFYKQRDQYAGTLLWIASHGIDAVWYVTGQRFDKVTGHGGNIAKTEWGDFEDHVTAHFVLHNGGSAMVHADYLRPAAAKSHGDDRLRVAGSLGVVEVRDGKCMLITQDQPAKDVTELGEGADVVADLIAALNGDVSVYGTQQSMTMARWLLAARDAADAGRWMELA